MRGWVTALILLSACRGHAAPETPACAAAVEPVPGLRVERAAGPGGCVTLVRIDPRRFRLRLLTALHDGGGRGVFVHARAPTAMSDFARFLGAQGLRAAMYVEGGPQASLYVKAGPSEVAEVGTGLIDNSSFYNIPNVLGFQPRED